MVERTTTSASKVVMEDAALFDDSHGGCDCEFPTVTFRSPPPSYPPIQGPIALERQVSHNLISHYVDMVRDDQGDEYGVFLDSFIDLYSFEPT